MSRGSGKNFSRDAKPRQKSRPGALNSSAAWRGFARAKLRAMKNRDVAATTGVFVMADRPRGRNSHGLVVGVMANPGGYLGNPATNFAWDLRRRLKPIRVAPTTITDAAGKVIATITVDPVTGKRTRTPA